MTVGLDEQLLSRIRPVTNIQRINAWFMDCSLYVPLEGFAWEWA